MGKYKDAQASSFNGMQSEGGYLVVLDDEFDASEVLSSSKLLIS